MSKKNIIILIIIAVIAAGGIGGYAYYKKYMREHQPNADIGTMPVTVPVVSVSPIATTGMAEPKEPQYTGLETDAAGLYPTLSGAYESIWDGYESIPIDILADGDDTFEAYYKFIWSREYVYVQVTVTDTTPDTSGGNYSTQDSVELFINEDGNKNSQLLVGDAHYIVNREGVKSYGRGANENFEAVTYETYDEEGNNTGYIVEAALPLMTIKASKNNSIGFDVQVNDCDGGELLSIRKWASDYLYTFQNFSALGTVTFK